MGKTADRSKLEAIQTSDSDVPAITPADIRVLIVDNDDAHAETVAESLQRVGYGCAVATSGSEGVRLIAHLIRVADESHLWATTFDRPAFTLEAQAEIAEQIAAAVTAR